MGYADQLDTPVQYVKGVGPKRAELFRQVGITTVRDLLDFFPRRYQFFGQVKKLKDLTEGESVTVIARIDEVDHQFHRYPARSFASISDDSDSGVVRWFHSRFLFGRLHPGQWIRVSGKITLSDGGPMFTNPKCEFFESVPEDITGSFTLPVYPAVPTIAPKTLSDLVQRAFMDYGNFITDWFDPVFLKEQGLLPLREAYTWIHKPEEKENWTQARKRLAYDELFYMQMGILLARRQREIAAGAIRLPCTDEIDLHIRRRFPFDLTEAQNRVIKEIIVDMDSDHQMYRMLQGDVGAGKTVVAVYAALVAVANHRQVAIMAPTEILAQQHYEKISQYLINSRVRIELLVGGINKKTRTKILDEAAQGKIDILIGTQALIQKDVEFTHLGLVIIDEQHKFGVAQRAAIRSKGTQPHYLVMTATPIPRTLALTVFGDLQMSIIDELPPGRKPVETRLFSSSQRDRVWEFLRRSLQRGQQAFVVYPLLDPSDKLELNSAREEEKRLAETVFPEFRIGLIHGKMKSEEKKQIMHAFANKQIDLLVATVVIEVGIDVPDAGVLVVEHGERFGLAQLHQLRGRIGRGGQQAYCLILADPKTEISQKRLDVFTKTNDGFKIAEEDLRIRGPGEFFGTAQHGLPELKLADLIDDLQLLIRARQNARQILAQDPQLVWLKHQRLKEELIRRLGQKLGLIEAA
ncbi:MAG: ATP-dependent DNA helicase RecG [Phycisphaerae bacterium]